MKNSVIFLASLFAAAICFAEKTLLSPEEVAARRQAARARSGGVVAKPGSSKGSIAVVNAQSVMADADLNKAIESVNSKNRFVVDCKAASPGKIEELLKTVSGEFKIVLHEDDSSPALLVAPEERWAAVNVRKLNLGLPQGDVGRSLWVSRCRKEFVRAFSMLCGGALSIYPSNLFAATGVKDLDSYTEDVPVDMTQKYNKYLISAGLKPKIVAGYRRACEQGWAPQPTNDVQKAIWAEVHQLPTKPIKIKPETKKVTE